MRIGEGTRAIVTGASKGIGRALAPIGRTPREPDKIRVCDRVFEHPGKVIPIVCGEAQLGAVGGGQQFSLVPVGARHRRPERLVRGDRDVVPGRPQPRPQTGVGRHVPHRPGGDDQDPYAQWLESFADHLCTGAGDQFFIAQRGLHQADHQRRHGELGHQPSGADVLHPGTRVGNYRRNPQGSEQRLTERFPCGILWYGFAGGSHVSQQRPPVKRQQMN